MIPPALQILARLALAERWLLAFDFDGTLVPLADHPDAVAFRRPAWDALSLLARHRPVAVISGRARADLAARCPPGMTLIGNHGAEGLEGISWIEGRAREAATLWLPRLRGRFTGGGCWVEDKGLSLSLHWRASPDHVRAEAVARRLCEELWPTPRLVPGNLVLNVQHADLPDKRVALLHLLRRHPAALFVGDDWNDATALASGEPRLHGIQVGDLPLGAPWRLPDQAAVEALLAVMAQEITHA